MSSWHSGSPSTPGPKRPNLIATESDKPLCPQISLDSNTPSQIAPPSNRCWHVAITTCKISYTQANNVQASPFVIISSQGFMLVSRTSAFTKIKLRMIQSPDELPYFPSFRTHSYGLNLSQLIPDAWKLRLLRLRPLYESLARQSLIIGSCVEGGNLRITGSASSHYSPYVM